MTCKKPQKCIPMPSWPSDSPYDHHQRCPAVYSVLLVQQRSRTVAEQKPQAQRDPLVSASTAIDKCCYKGTEGHGGNITREVPEGQAFRGHSSQATAAAGRGDETTRKHHSTVITESLVEMGSHGHFAKHAGRAIDNDVDDACSIHGCGMDAVHGHVQQKPMAQTISQAVQMNYWTHAMEEGTPSIDKARS